MKCQTVGCTNVPTVMIHWEDDVNETVCDECWDSYRRRPWVLARAWADAL